MGLIEEMTPSYDKGGEKNLKGRHVHGRLLDESVEQFYSSAVANEATRKRVGRQSERVRRPNYRMEEFITRGNWPYSRKGRGTTSHKAVMPT